MSTFKPFKGLRPVPEKAELIASPPYDVINSDEARQMAEGNPLSFLHVVKPEIDLDPGIDLYDDRVYAKAAENFRRLVDEEHMIQDDNPSYYIYAQQMGDHRQVGIVGCASADDYYADVIRKHEHTRPEKVNDRTRHVDTLSANAGPVFLTYRANPGIDTLVSVITAGEPTYDFTSDDGVRHTLWAVSDAKWTGKVEGIFRDIPVLYVADGHHRSASAANVRNWRREKNPGHTGEEEYNYFLAVSFPHDQMNIMAYNRVVADLAGRTPEELLEALATSFEVAETDSPTPAGPRRFCMYLGGTWYLLTARDGTFDADDPVRRLDCSILQENVLAPLLGISDPRTDQRIHFVGGIRGTGELKRLVDGGQYTVAFSLYPTSITDLMSVADAGQVMPPKSTWFEPKLRSGLVVHLLD